MRLRLSICVVLYGSVDMSRRFADELAASLAGFEDVEISFYDNSADDELRELAKFGNYTHDSRNLGFSYANNQLILSSNFENILLLNPDVFGFSQEFWIMMSENFARNEVRFVKLLNVDGSYQDCVGESTGLVRAMRGPRAYHSLEAPTEVEMGIMAFMLTTRAVFAQVGLLDTDYALYAEDMDWCFRARARGIRLIYDPRLSLVHVGGASASDRWSRRDSLKRKYSAERIFVDKHFRGLHWLALRCLNRLKMHLRTRA